MRESAIEKRICDHARSKGWIVLKLSGANHDAGKPDRLFLRNGQAVFMEIKAKGACPTALQERWLTSLIDQGFTAVWTDNVEDGCRVIDQLTTKR
jgi:hypothetical protein